MILLGGSLQRPSPGLSAAPMHARQCQLKTPEAARFPRAAGGWEELVHFFSARSGRATRPTSHFHLMPAHLHDSHVTTPFTDQRSDMRHDHSPSLLVEMLTADRARFQTVNNHNG